MNAINDSLEGVRVISVEQAVAAPLCSRHLSELGAQVLKVEPREGDFARRFDDFVEGYASHFVWLNHGKESLPLDLRSQTDLNRLKGLVDEADVLISNIAPGKAETLLPIEDLRRRNPGLIRCVISGYGDSGPYRFKKAYDALVQGEAAVTLNTGIPGQPAKSAISIADVGAGAYAFGAIVAALHKRQKTGNGSDIHISLFDVLAEWMMPLVLAEKYSGQVPTPSGTRHASIVPYGAFETRDGDLANIAVQTDVQWLRFARTVLQDNELAEKVAFRTNSSRLANRDELERQVKQGIESMDSAELYQRLNDADIPNGRMNSVKDVIDHPQIIERERWYPVELPDGRESEALLPAFLSEASPGGLRRVPGLGTGSGP